MGGKHQAPATPELVERLEDAAERHPGPPDGINRLLKQAAAALEAQQARIAELEGLLDLHAAMQSEVERAQAAEGASQALADRYEKALRELVALVRGECPRLLDEDSGGNAALSIEIDEALSSQGRHEGGEDSSSRSQPCGVGPSDLTDPQSQHSDGEGW